MMLKAMNAGRNNHMAQASILSHIACFLGSGLGSNALKSVDYIKMGKKLLVFAKSNKLPQIIDCSLIIINNL